MDRRIAVGRVEDVPVTARQLAHEGEQRVAEKARQRHVVHALEPEEAVALGVVALADVDRINEFSE